MRRHIERTPVRRWAEILPNFKMTNIEDFMNARTYPDYISEYKALTEQYEDFELLYRALRRQKFISQCAQAVTDLEEKIIADTEGFSH